MMYLKLAWRNIWRNKRRSFITMASITFAVVLACVMRSMQLGSYDRMIENAARFYTGYVQIHKNGYWDDKTIDNSFSYDESLLSKIEAVPQVALAVPRVESFALAANGTKTRGAFVLGVNPDKEDGLTNIKKRIVKGEFLGLDDKAVIIAQGLADYLNLTVGDTVILISQGYHGANAAGLYPVKGIIKFPVPEQNNRTIYMPLPAAQWFFNLDNQLSSIALVVNQAKQVDKVVHTLKSDLDMQKLEVMGWKDMMPDLVQGIEIDNLSGRVMLWLLYAVIGFGMFGTFLMMTAERMYEFGVMMSIGMKRLTMQFTIFLEMAMMTAMGVLAGVSISLPILIHFHFNPIYYSAEAAKAFESFNVEAAYFFSLQPSLFYNQAWAIFFMALLLSIYPLIVIQKLKPVQAMRESV